MTKKHDQNKNEGSGNTPDPEDQDKNLEKQGDGNTPDPEGDKNEENNEPAKQEVKKPKIIRNGFYDKLHGVVIPSGTDVTTPQYDDVDFTHAVFVESEENNEVKNA